MYIAHSQFACSLVLVSLGVLRHSTSTKSVGPDPTVYIPVTVAHLSSVRSLFG
jgi:hypothetical protein